MHGPYTVRAQVERNCPAWRWDGFVEGGGRIQVAFGRGREFAPGGVRQLLCGSLNKHGEFGERESFCRVGD